MIGSAFRKSGKPVVLVALGKSVHAGHIALVRAAQAIRGGVVVVAVENAAADSAQRDIAALREEGVDIVFDYSEQLLWPHGRRSLVTAQPRGLEPGDILAAELTRLLALVGAVGPSDVIVGEKDYELLIAFHQAVQDLHLGVRVQGVPTVRTRTGLAMSLRNTEIADADRDKAEALSAALTAGAHAAESGAAEVERVARSVVDAAGIEVDYLAVRGKDLGPAPAEGDGRLLVAATLGGVRIIDNVGLPLGIGFRNLEEHEAKEELAREQQRS